MKTIFDEDEIKTVYEKLHMYSRKQVDEGIAKLTRKERDFLYFRYDGDLDNNYLNPDFSKENDKYFYFAILPKIKRNIEKLIKEKSKKQQNKSAQSAKNFTKASSLISEPNKRKSKTIYEYFEKYPRNLINEVLSQLDEKDKALIFVMNGKNLDNPTRENAEAKHTNLYYNYLLPKIQNILDSKITIYREKQNNQILIKLFNGYPIELIHEVLKEFSENEKNLIFLMKDYPKNKYIDENTRKKYYELINKIRVRLEEKLLEQNNNEEKKSNPNDGEAKPKMEKPEKTGKRIKTIYEICEKYPRSLVDEVLSELNEKEKALMFIMNGKNLDNPVRGKIDKKTQTSYSSVLIPKIKRKLEKKNTLKEEKGEETPEKTNITELSALNIEIKDSIFRKLMSFMSPLDIAVLNMKLGSINFTNEQVALVLGITPEEVIKITKEVLIKYKNLFNKQIDELIETLNNSENTKKLVK